MVEKNYSRKTQKFPCLFPNMVKTTCLFLLSCNLITGELTCGNHVTHK